MEHGEIRVCRINPDDHMDLSDYWVLSMHDNLNGYIPKMLLSHDHKMLLTCGYDGNLFSFYINDESSYLAHKVPIPERQLTMVSLLLNYKNSIKLRVYYYFSSNNCSYYVDSLLQMLKT